MQLFSESSHLADEGHVCPPGNCGRLTLATEGSPGQYSRRSFWSGRAFAYGSASRKQDCAISSNRVRLALSPSQSAKPTYSSSFRYSADVIGHWILCGIQTGENVKPRRVHLRCRQLAKRSLTYVSRCEQMDKGRAVQAPSQIKRAVYTG